MDRDAFLARVRSAARQGRQYRVVVDPPPPERPGVEVQFGPGMVERFLLEVQRLGGGADRAANDAAAAEKVKAFLTEFSVQTLLLWEDPVLERIGVEKIARDLGCTVHRHENLAKLSPPARQAAILSADGGITGATWAVAETGSVAVASGPGTERVASLTPPVHLALVDRGRIVPDLYDFFDRLAAAGLENLASNVVLISGPSKTGDIEMNLVVGVHGPGIWRVVVVG